MDRWKKLCAKIGKDRFLIMIIGGLLLFVIACPVSSDASGEETEEAQGQSEGEAGALSAQNTGAESEMTQESDYAKALQTQLSEILSDIDGAGKVEVCLSFADYGTGVVEKDTSYTRDNEEKENESEQKTTSVLTENSEETVFTTDEEGNEAPFVSKTLTPSVEGALVVAQGGGNEAVAQEMKEAIMALFGIEEHKIKVVKMKGEEQ